MTDGGEEEAECEVSMVQKTRGKSERSSTSLQRLMESQHATISCEVEDVES